MNFIKRMIVERMVRQGVQAMFGPNWKTSLGGLGMILAGLSDIVHGLTIDGAMVHWEADIASIIGGIGLMFAKDKNVTGGTVMQPTSTEVLVEKKEEIKAKGV